MSEPTKKLLALILDRRIEHNNHPVLTWTASNLSLRQDAHGGQYPDKKQSIQKIDPMVALIEALQRASFYESDGEVPDVFTV